MGSSGFFGITNLFVLIGFIVTYFVISRAVRRHARESQKVFEEIKEGNFSRRLEIRDTGDIGHLTATFNDMADQLEFTISKLSKQESALRELLQELTHDLKTPIASMFSLTQGLQSTKKKFDRK